MTAGFTTAGADAMDSGRDEPSRASGVAGVLKFIGILAVLLLAALGVLFVLDVFPREMLADAAVKSVVILGIVAAASLAIGMLMRARSS
jgi:hypothetical protein